MLSSAITVFLIDDDESVLRAMARLMKAVQFQAICLHAVDELLTHQLPAEGAVIVADVSTARAGMATFTRQLHGLNQGLPVIYVTDFDTDYTREEARRAGAAGYFRKPVDEQALVDAITFAVKQSTTSPVT